MSNSVSYKQKFFLLITGGLVAGFMNGLLGAGGGILLVYIMNFLFSRQKNAPDKRDIFANALAAMLPVTAVSVVSYASRGNLHVTGVEIFVIPAILGGLGGAWLLDKLKPETIRRLFTMIVILSGIAMLVKA